MRIFTTRHAIPNFLISVISKTKRHYYSKRCFLTSLVLLICCFGFFLQSGDLSGSHASQTVPEPEFESPPSREFAVSEKKLYLKKILLYNHPHWRFTKEFGLGHEPFVRHQCPVSDCELFQEPSDSIPLKEYDAVIVEAVKIRIFSKSQKTALVSGSGGRSPHQRYVLYLTEPSLYLNFLNTTQFDKVFNWTMTYKKSSDIHFPYGIFESLSAEPPIRDPNSAVRFMSKETLGLLRNKSKLVAWFVSHCNTDSAREQYVAKLKNYLGVDVYGKCGNYTCPVKPGTHYSESECYDKVERKYKFYLSFENAFCNEYATEKLFIIMKYHVVPIVYGKADYKDILPEHSYINALDYSPKRLATYLNYLDKNDTAYREYFWWKPHYRLYAGWNELSARGMCTMCAKLHEPLVPKVYSGRELAAYSNTGLNCWTRPLALVLLDKFYDQTTTVP